MSAVSAVSAVSDELPRCFGVFGDPIAHSRSPIMHNAAFEAMGLAHRYLPFHVGAGRLGEAVRGAAALGFGGVNLTVPHKQAVASLCDRLTAAAERIGAVNTLRFVRDGDRCEIHGDNTDARGFLDALAELDGAPLQQATILGAGGASRAIADALLGFDPGLELTWVSRRPERIVLPVLPGREQLEGRVRRCTWSELGGQLGGPRGELLVNTTIVGLPGGPVEFPGTVELGELDPRARVVDIVYPRPRGGLLDRAQAMGFAVQDGLPMLLWQGVRALELWLERELPAAAIAGMRAALEPLEPDRE